MSAVSKEKAGQLYGRDEAVVLQADDAVLDRHIERDMRRDTAIRKDLPALDRLPFSDLAIVFIAYTP